MEERGTLIEELRVVRSQLRQAIAAGSHLGEKLVGPKPESTTQPKELGESVVTLVTEIKQQAFLLCSILGAHHSIVGNFDRNPEKASQLSGAAAVPRY